MQIPLLTDIVIIFALSVLVLFVCNRIRIPAIVGFLVTGVVAGPHGFKLVTGIAEVDVLAQIGVVTLLFTIGIEFSMRNLLKVKRAAVLGGSLQVILTILVIFGIARGFGLDFGKALFTGFLISLSSTAIVLKLLQEKGLMESPHGQTSIAILLFQDVIVIPMMLFTPILAGGQFEIGRPLLLLLAKGVAIILAVIVCAQWIVPKLLFQIARTRSPELFMLSIVLICSAVAYFTSALGLSLALGAFLAGLIISESEYSYQALGNVLPFRDVFTSFFFVSIGMLLDLQFVSRHLWLLAAATLAVLIIKAFLAGLSGILLGFPIRIAALIGLCLCQVGEFSFILSRAGVEEGLLSGHLYQYFLAVSVLTMAVTPLIIGQSSGLAELLARIPMPKKLVSGLHPAAEPDTAAGPEPLKDHLLIIGFGINGRNVARAAKIASIPYVVIETNPETVNREKARNETILYGDAVQAAVLKRAGIKEARVAVVAISDPVATRKIVANLRSLNPRVHIISRTRFVQEVKPLYELGADEVIPEEFETSVEIFTRVLSKYLIPYDEIENFVSELRAEGYKMFRSLSREQVSLSDLRISPGELDIRNFRVGPGSPAEGKTLGRIELRKKYGVTAVALRRGARLNSDLDRDTALMADDIVVVMGQPEKIAQAAFLFKTPDSQS